MVCAIWLKMRLGSPRPGVCRGRQSAEASGGRAGEDIGFIIHVISSKQIIWPRDSLQLYNYAVAVFIQVYSAVDPLPVSTSIQIFEYCLTDASYEIFKVRGISSLASLAPLAFLAFPPRVYNACTVPHGHSRAFAHNLTSQYHSFYPLPCPFFQHLWLRFFISRLPSI